jgi:hypothetical protein
MYSIINDVGTYVLRPFCPQIVQHVPTFALKNTVNILATSSMEVRGGVQPVGQVWFSLFL